MNHRIETVSSRAGAVARALVSRAAALIVLALGTPLSAQEPEPVVLPAEHEVDVPVVELDDVTDEADDRPQDRRTRRLTRPRRVIRDDEPRARVGLGLGYGRFEINARDLGGVDVEDAAVFRLDAEFWATRHLGFGVTAELVSTGDDLFEGQQVESGAGLRPADAQIGSSDLSAYFAWDPFGGDRFRMPLAIGPWFSSTVIDYDRARIDYTFSTLGVRAGVRPEVTLVDADRVSVVAFAGASYSIGFAGIYEDLIGNNETYDSEAQQFRAEGGVRVDLRHVSLGFHYVFSDMGINLSQAENGRRVPELDFDTNMYFFTIAGRF